MVVARTSVVDLIVVFGFKLVGTIILLKPVGVCEFTTPPVGARNIPVESVVCVNDRVLTIDFPPSLERPIVCDSLLRDTKLVLHLTGREHTFRNERIATAICALNQCAAERI